MMDNAADTPAETGTPVSEDIGETRGHIGTVSVNRRYTIAKLDMRNSSR
jgi:hypothetical protein